MLQCNHTRMHNNSAGNVMHYRASLSRLSRKECCRLRWARMLWPERAQLPAESGRSKVAHRLSAKGAEVLGSDAVRVNGGLQGGLHLRQQ